MPTVSRTWVFNADTEGLADVGDSANIPINWDGTPAMLEFGAATGGSNDFERARGPVTAGNDWPTLFPGLPSNAIVTDAQCNAWKYQRFNIGTLTAWRVRIRIVDSSGTIVHSGGELIDFTDSTPATDGAKQTGTAPGTSRAVDSAKQAASTLVALELRFDRTGGGLSDIDFDDIQITVTYSLPSLAQPQTDFSLFPKPKLVRV